MNASGTGGRVQAIQSRTLPLNSRNINMSNSLTV